MKKAASTKKPFFNRELSWLEFNQRVLDEASNPDVPLLERLKFLAITASNLAEFFMVRVGGLYLLQQHRIAKRDPSGLTPRKRLKAVSDRAHSMVAEQYRLYNEVLETGLSRAGIVRVAPSAMTNEQKVSAERFFLNEIVPVVTPMAVYEDQVFPLLVNVRMNLIVRLAPERAGMSERFAVIPLVGGLPRFVSMPSNDEWSFALIEDVAGMFIDRLFPGETVLECTPFIITRNADLEVRDEFAQDLLSEMEDILRARAKSDTVRLEAGQGMSRSAQAFLKRVLGISSEQVYELGGPPALNDFMQIALRDGFDRLRYETWLPQHSPQIDQQAGMFENIADRNILLHHPYESFDPVLRLIQEAAEDPHVLAIKQILYRTSSRSPVVAALTRAARNGKHVAVIVELKARFDEARNIDWARRMEEAGVQVIYGVRGFKTHAKLCLIVRKEPAKGIERYVHFGTGNYNEATARLYTDISFLTCDPDLGTAAAAFFNAITGYSQPVQYARLYAAPIAMRARLLELIEGEMVRARQGQKSRIRAKVNSLVDPDIINALYRASDAGVRIELIVRGMCCLMPGVKGLSEKISVVSIIDRFLEHSRIFCFSAGGDDTVLISSADWMPRNLDRRCELMVEINDAAAKARLIEILDSGLNDTVKGKWLQPDGMYLPAAPGKLRKGRRSQQGLYESACRAIDRQIQAQRTVFKPHRPS